MNQTPEYYNKKQQEEKAETYYQVTLINDGNIY